VQQWEELCEEFHTILLVPRPKEADRWLPTETEFIRKTIEFVLARYNVGRDRIVAHGYQGAGAMAFLTAFSQRELIRGVAAVDAPLPLRLSVPANEPLQRLAVLMATAKESPLTARIEADVERLREARFPVTSLDLGAQPHPLNANQREQLLRWVDTLDRI
jgi:predicted esterase